MSNITATQTGAGWDVDGPTTTQVLVNLDTNGRPTGELTTPDGQPVGGGINQMPASTSISLDAAAESVLSPLSVAGPTTITISGSANGAQASMLVIANGTDSPTISGATEWANSFGYLNTDGIPNLLSVWHDGLGARYAWSQAQSPVAVGAFVLDSLVDITRSGETYTGAAAPAGGWGIAKSTSMALRAGADGWISIKREVGTNEFFILAFDTTNSIAAGGAPMVQVQWNASNEIRVGQSIQIGAAPTVVSTYTAGAGRRYRLGRVGSVWSVQTSADYGVTWTVVHTITGVTNTGTVYPYLMLSANRQGTGLRQSGLT